MLKPQPHHLDNGLGIDKWSTEHRDDCCILQRQRSGLDVASVAPWWADFEHKYGDFTKNFMVIYIVRFAYYMNIYQSSLVCLKMGEWMELGTLFSDKAIYE